MNHVGRSVLGIDAAWTVTQPSGVALVTDAGTGWKLSAVDSSYAAFYRRAGLDEHAEGFDASCLLDSAARIGGQPVTLVAADIPLARTPITQRRPSDNAVSRLYGARRASTHSPSATRPGALADGMRADFANAGYALQTTAPASAGLIEVYPHPALIELANAASRLPYKMGKTAKYWPGMALAERRSLLLDQWRQIVALLETRIIGVASALPVPFPTMTGRGLKAYEDALDAVVCAWVGVCVLDEQAIALGDADSAIWVPLPSLAP